MFKITQYHFNKDINTKTLYQKVLSDKGDAKDLSELSQNYVSKNTTLLSSPKNLIKHTANIHYERKLKTYYAVEPGYINYSKVGLELLPLIWINNNQTRCITIIPIKNKAKKSLSHENLVNALANLNLTEIIDPEKIDKVIALYNNNQGGKVLLAKGEPPINGSPAIIDLIYDVETKIGKEDKTGKIDYRNKGYTSNVSKGEVIAKYQPPKAPHLGRDIFGDAIHPSNDEPPTFIQGEGLELDEENNELIAAGDGILIISEDKEISVSDMEVIVGNVDLNIGNLDVNGGLLIKGDVCPGLEVKANGSIQIEGNVEESSVSAGKNLVIKGGFIGNKQSKMEVTGDCRVGFIRNGLVRGGGNLQIKGFVMSSDITVKGKVIANHEKMGKVIGGKICGARGIDTCFVGNSSGTKTFLTVGVDIEEEEYLEKLEHKIQGIDQSIARLKTLLGNSYFNDPKRFLMNLPKDKLFKVEGIISSLKDNLNQKKLVQKEIEDLSSGKNEFKQTTIIIRKESHEGMSIQIGNKVKHFKHKIPSPTAYIYSREQKDIIPTSVDRLDKLNK